jgi:hypothetical protein
VVGSCERGNESIKSREIFHQAWCEHSSMELNRVIRPLKNRSGG